MFQGYTVFGYKPNFEWELRGLTVKKHSTVYPCCPLEPYISLGYQFELARHAVLYATSVIMPAFGTSNIIFHT